MTRSVWNSSDARECPFLTFSARGNGSVGEFHTNPDKHRAVEIALREYPGLSSRQIAEMCGVHHTFVEHLRPEQVATVATSEPETRTGRDGKQYPARRQTEPPPPKEPPRQEPQEEKPESVKKG